MAKTERIKDEIMERDATRLWYKDGSGKIAMVVQYSPVDWLRDEPVRPEETPIYVALEGQRPVELIELLNSYQVLSNRQNNRYADYDKALDDLRERHGALRTDFERHIRQRRWWQFWKGEK